MSGGANAATAACEVGIQSISPITKTITTTSTTGTAALSGSSRNGRPISGIATPSFTEPGTPAVQRISRNCTNATSAGFTITSTPQSEGARPYVVTSGIGSSTSYATYVIDARTDEPRKSRNGRSRTITRNEPRCGGSFGAYAPVR